MSAAYFVERGHRFPLEGRRYVSPAGPLEGEWLVHGCLDCNAFLIGVADPDIDAVELVVAALAAAGCDPRPKEVA